MNSDLVSLIVDSKNEIVKLQRVVGGKEPMTANLNMEGYRILNIAQPRDPREYESDLVSSKIPYDYMSKVDQNYMKWDRDGSLNGRLNMSNHKISGLADPTDADDAVTRRYVASRFQALRDEVQGNKSKLGSFLNLLEVVNNQVLIREYEITGTDFEHDSSIRNSSIRNKTRAYFREYPRVSDYIATMAIFGMFTLKENLM